MRLAPEGVGDLPIVGTGLAGQAFATLDVPGVNLLVSPIAARIGAHRCPRDCAAGRGNILTASAPNLMAEYAANDGPDDRAGHIDATTFLNDLFAFDPASLFGCAEHGANRGDVRLIQPLIVTSTAIVDGNRSRRVTIIINACASAYHAHR